MYEVLIATGTGKHADTNNTVEFSLVYGDNQISQPLRPGSNPHNNHDNAFQEGSLDICRDCDFKSQGGESLDVENITAVDIDFEGERWLVEKVWITNVNTGYTVCSGDPVWVGSEEAGSHYRLPLKQETALDEATNRRSFFFDLTVKTSSDDNSGTNDTVHFKLFSADGRSSECHRAKRPGDQYETGQTDEIKGFFNSYWFKGLKLIGGPIDFQPDSEPFKIDTRIIKVLIAKEGIGGWRPESLAVKASLGHNQPVNTFQLLEHLGGDNHILDKDHKWVCVEAESLP